MADERPVTENPDGGVDIRSAEERAARHLQIGPVPALYIDTWNLNSWQGHVRITFGESLGRKDYFRTAIVVDTDDAISLARQLLRFAQDRKERDLVRAARELKEKSDED